MGELTTGQLIEQIKKLAIAIDPDWARRRYAEAVDEPRVVGYRNRDGSANLSGLNLPVDRVATASARIDTLAKAAKRAGHPDPLDHVRADLYLGMIDGSYTGLDDATILGLLRTTQPTDDTDDPTGTDDSVDADVDVECHEAEGGAATGRRGGMELRVRLSTLLARDRCPGELAGWGLVHAELARDLAATLRGARWWFAIVDDEGHLLHSGITRARPDGPRGRGRRGGDLLEVAVPTTLLTALVADPASLGPWATVVADFDHQYRAAAPGRFTGDAGRRMPGAALRRHLQIRDRTCHFPPCRATARGADIDHTIAHGHGGRTIEINLGGLCKHDHRLKDEGGWALQQPEPGHFLWTSRLGHRYAVQPPRIIEPLPDPIPGNHPSPPHPRTPGVDQPIWDEPPPPPQAQPPPPPPDPDDDPPPF
ncbi:MAG: HNH endonuclease signature motif containing protein [Pseudonocardiaceae bacterium]